MNTKIYYFSTLFCYFGIIALLIYFYGVVPDQLPPEQKIWNRLIGQPNMHLIMVIFLFPLLFPAIGLLRGNPYTYKWTIFISLLYFAHGITEAWSLPSLRLFGILETFLSLLWLASLILYVRATRTTQSL